MGIIWPPGHRWRGGEVTEDRVTVTKEMAVTHADFFRILPSAFPDCDYDIQGTTIWRQRDGGTLEIKLGPEGTRRIALLKLPQTSITLTFRGYSQSQRSELIEQFDKGFQRAGG